MSTAAFRSWQRGWAKSRVSVPSPRARRWIVRVAHAYPNPLPSAQRGSPSSKEPLNKSHMSRVSAMASDARPYLATEGAANSLAYSQAAQQRRWGHCAETRRDGAYAEVPYLGAMKKAVALFVSLVLCAG